MVENYIKVGSVERVRTTYVEEEKTSNNVIMSFMENHVKILLV